MRFRLVVVTMLACTLATIVLGLAPGSAHALPYTAVVDVDSADPSPGNATCDSPCTLRRAIQSANSSPGLDTITLGAGTHQLGVAGGNEDAAATGDLDVLAGDLIITGAGASSTIVDGGDLDRVFDLRAGTITMSGMTVRNGFTEFLPPPNQTSGGHGGGLRTVGSSNVAVTDSTIADNAVHAAGHGGGAATFDTSTLTLTRTSVASNEATETSGGGGGVSEESPGSTVKIVDSTVTGNRATFAAGVWDDGTGTVEITRSTVSGNSTVPDPSFGGLQQGGGVVEGAGTVRITDSVISNNTATYGAGVIDEGGTLTITNSTISGNHAQAVAGNTPPGSSFPYSNGVGGGLLGYGGGNITVTGTTLSGNTADLNGGAIAFQTAGAVPQVQFVNSTIADNTAGTAGGAARLDGSTALSFINTTIDGNAAPIGANLNLCSGGPPLPAGYCASAGPSTVTLRNSIVSGGSSANCAKSVGAFASAGHNLDSGNSCGFGAGGDRVNTNPLLGPLALNGGGTRTKALQDGSPAIDSAAACPATDQRGSPRPFGPLCDIGAFEGGVPATVAAAAVTPPTPQCRDGRDNDSDGAVDSQDPGCTTGADTNEGDENLGDLILCGRRQISLVRADAKGRKVALSGLVSKANSGKPVTILANYGRRGKAGSSRFTALKTVRTKSNGEFSVTVAGPPRRLFAKARFQARVGRSRSVTLKLPQSLASSSIRKVGANVVLRGTVRRSLLGKRNPISVRRLVCGRYQTVASAKPDRSGRYTARFRVPALSDAALYRAESRVLAKPGSKRYVKQFARAVGIAFKASR